MAGHFERVGRSLGASVAAYNQAMGSLEGRVLVSARRFVDLGVTTEALAEPRQVETVPRSAAAPELGMLDDLLAREGQQPAARRAGEDSDAS